MRRWFTAKELGEHIAESVPRVAKMEPKRRREYAVRVVQRLETEHEAKLIRRAGGRVLISKQALAMLAPTAGPSSAEVIAVTISGLISKNKEIRAKLKAQVAELRDLKLMLAATEKRLATLEAINEPT